MVTGGIPVHESHLLGTAVGGYIAVCLYRQHVRSHACMMISNNVNVPNCTGIVHT